MRLHTSRLFRRQFAHSRSHKNIFHVDIGFSRGRPNFSPQALHRRLAAIDQVLKKVLFLEQFLDPVDRRATKTPQTARTAKRRPNIDTGWDCVEHEQQIRRFALLVKCFRDCQADRTTGRVPSQAVRPLGLYFAHTLDVKLRGIA